MNRHGCTPREDVCMTHHLPLDCKHGCYLAEPHNCRFKREPGWTSALSAERRAELDEWRYGPTEPPGSSGHSERT